MIKLPFESVKKEFDVHLELNEKELRRLPKENFLIVANEIAPAFREQIIEQLKALIGRDKFNDTNDHSSNNELPEGQDVHNMKEFIYFLPEMNNRFQDFRNGKTFRKINKSIVKENRTILPVRFYFADPQFGLPARLKSLVSDEPLRLKLRIGKPITVEKQNSFSSISRFSRYLQSKILSLGIDVEDKGLFNNPFRRSKIEEEIASPVDAEVISREIAALTFENLIAQQSEFDVIVASSDQIPNTLLEIGRLREIAFRAVSEGTGKSRDLDEYDVHYHQLIIWDREAKKIAGGYRMGPGDQILNRFGKSGFYINSLFKIKADFLPIMKESVELGRSYIAPEYQKKRLPLFLLWKGILFYLLKNPQYRYLYGPMSISKDYSTLSKSLIVAFIRRYFYNEELASFLQPRKPFRAKVPKVDIEVLMDGLGSEIKFLDNIIEELEPNHFKVPILLRQYVKLNAKFISFNVDPAFSNVLDGFIILDLNDVPLAMIEALKKEV